MLDSASGSFDRSGTLAMLGAVASLAQRRSYTMRTRLTVVGLALGVFAAVPAAAQTPCPPDGWFCDDEPARSEEAPAPDTSSDWQTPEGDEDTGERRPQPGKPAIVVAPEDDRLDPEQGSLLERRRARPSSPWGVNVRLEGVMMGHRARYGDAGMGGLGASLRYQPLPAVAVDLGLDVLGGTDYNGFDRTELMWSLSGLFFFNPRMPVKVYTLAGLNMSAADVEVVYVDGVHDDQGWDYFGGHIGLGVQADLAPRLALSFDLTGFLRGRTDSRARREPEFIDSRGRMTNMSGGGLLRGGLTFFW
jgi:hypothetical protein